MKKKESDSAVMKEFAQTILGACEEITDLEEKLEEQSFTIDRLQEELSSKDSVSVPTGGLTAKAKHPFGRSSQKKLEQCHPKLQALFTEVARTCPMESTILVGHRNAEDQNQAVADGRSKLRFPQSKHNVKPSKAIDIAPYPIKWDDVKSFGYFAGFVMATADRMGIKVRWGGDWDRDGDLRDNNFNDLPHFELDE